MKWKNNIPIITGFLPVVWRLTVIVSLVRLCTCNMILPFDFWYHVKCRRSWLSPHHAKWNGMGLNLNSQCKGNWYPQGRLSILKRLLPIQRYDMTRQRAHLTSRHPIYQRKEINLSFVNGRWWKTNEWAIKQTNNTIILNFQFITFKYIQHITLNFS